jgi:hypothetical protein
MGYYLMLKRNKITSHENPRGTSNTSVTSVTERSQTERTNGCMTATVDVLEEAKSMEIIKWLVDGQREWYYR